MERVSAEKIGHRKLAARRAKRGEAFLLTIGDPDLYTPPLGLPWTMRRRPWKSTTQYSGIMAWA
jgi:hypothetical protein